MKRPKQGRGLFYTRDSGGKHEMTPTQYLGWAVSVTNELGLSFDGSSETIQSMIQQGEPSRGDVFLDFGVCGNLLSRPGLDRMLAEAETDPSVSHILIPRRDRFARPDDPLDAIAIEHRLRRNGITLVFMNRVCPPLAKGERASIEELLGGVIDYDRAGKDRTDLAQKIIYAQLSLAKEGYSTGGRPPYGFRRWLVKDDGTKIRQLQEGERVRMRGHHVVWFPGPDSELAVIRRILDLLRKMPASQVARRLTDDGVASPDTGRTRTDNGVKHVIHGIWHQTTIINIARNPLLVAICSYGRRSMGDQLRYAANGPRGLNDDDFRADGKPKVIRNPEEAMSRTPARFDALVDRDNHRDLIEILDHRGSSQRGKPRSRDPDKNPLGSRIVDMNCGWPMYRTPYGNTYRYTCGGYMQSRQCDHNHVDGPMATQFVLTSLRQKLVNPRVLQKLKERLRELAEGEQIASSHRDELAVQQAELVMVNANLKKVQGNMALADNREQYRAMALVFEDLRTQQADLERRVATAASHHHEAKGVDAQVDAAMAVLGRLPDLALDDRNLAKIGEAFRLVNVRLFLKFKRVQVKKRILNKLAHGVLTFGEAAPPVPLYAGPTGRRAIIANRAAAVAAGPGEGDESTLPSQDSPGREGNSSGNVNRGDRI